MVAEKLRCQAHLQQNAWPDKGCPTGYQQAKRTAAMHRGTLAQYAGRLHREHDQKKEVVIYDYLDENVPMLFRMFEKRRRGYRAQGYDIAGAFEKSG